MQSTWTESGDDSLCSVVLQDYDPEWVRQFEVDRERIVGALGERAKRVEHVGSTSILGMKAKPIIDIAVAVDSFSAVDDDAIVRLREIGYEFVPKVEFPGRRFFRRGTWGAGTHHLHLYEDGSPSWENILLFRDHLREHPDKASEYMALKERLAQMTGDRQTYTDLKGPFVESVVRQARVAALSEPGRIT
ncbi:MAG: GrpB family protein [Firmicutes bacterium]|nr:GrpB family protein [Bacillota bacterium]